MTEAAIADHGLIGDLQPAALVSTEGSVDWFCCPRFDSPSVFGALLDDDRGGHFRIRPAWGGYESKQMYLPDTAVLITRFISENGVGEVVDFMPPSGQEATDNHRLVRMVRCVRGEMCFEVEVAPRFDYGRSPHRTETTEHGAVFTTDALTLTVHAVREPEDERLAHGRVEEGDVKLSIDLKTGDVRGLVLESAADGPPQEIRVAEFQRMFGTTATPGCARCLVLHLRAAAARLHRRVRPVSRWLRDRVTEPVGGDGGPLNIMYRVDGSSDLKEESSEHWSGYRGSRPVRIGNGASDQLQLDIYGEALDSIFFADQHGLSVGHRGWTAVCELLDWLAGHWDQPEEGIWETRGGRQDFTSLARRRTGCRVSEGTFSLCSFSYVDALARAGRLDDARLAFEKMLTYANHVGLYSEEIALSGAQIGNFPQAFTHLAPIDAAITLDEALDRVAPG